MKHQRIRIGLGGALTALMIVGGSAAFAAPSVQKICGEEWTAAKKGGQVPAGQAWPGYLSECRKRHAGDTTTPAATPAAAQAAPAAAAPAAPLAPAPARIAAPAAVPAPTIAAQNSAEACKAEYDANKKAGSVPKGTNYFKYLSECRKRSTAAAVPGIAAPATATVAPTTPVTRAAAPAAAPTPAVAASENPADACKAEYETNKKAGAVPKGTNYFRYLSDCKKRRTAGGAPAAAPAAAPVAAAPAAATPPAPVAVAPARSAPLAAAPTAAAPAPATPVAGAKPASGGREAFIERERTCGARWKAIKGTTALPAGVTTWPKYLSYCNTRLKENLPI